jgi:hypothetical protein
LYSSSLRQNKSKEVNPINAYDSTAMRNVIAWIRAVGFYLSDTAEEHVHLFAVMILASLRCRFECALNWFHSKLFTFAERRRFKLFRYYLSKCC